MEPSRTRAFGEAFTKALQADDAEGVARALEDAPATAPNAALRSIDGARPLHLAAQAGAEAGVRLLLAHGADPAQPDAGGRLPLWLATIAGAAGAVRALLPASPSVPRRDLALRAIERNHPGVLRALLDEGVGPATFAEPRGFPLHIAAEMNCPECVRMLHEAGFEIEARDRLGHTPLHCAARAGKPESLRALIEAGADTEARTASGAGRGLKAIDIVGGDALDLRKADLCREILSAVDRREALGARGVCASCPAEPQDGPGL